MNTMSYGEYVAKIDYIEELDMFRGEVVNATGEVDFYGKSPEELREEFKASIEVYLEVCAEEGIQPIKNYTGKFPLRMKPRIHELVQIVATSQGKSMQVWLNEKIEESVEKSSAIKKGEGNNTNIQSMAN